MSQSKNWKAYYSGDFTQYDLTIEGDVQAHKVLDVEPGLKEADSPPINENYFHAQLVNAGDEAYKKVKEIFKVAHDHITTVVIFNKKGDKEAEVQVNAKSSSEEKSFGSDFSDDFK
jgi:hypothetical protein